MLADDRFTVSAEIRTLAERASCRAVLAVPLSMQERVVGVLNVSGRTGRIFGEEEVGLVQGFANEAAVALENARLYEDARAARDFLRSIATNSADAIITTDVRGRTTYFSPGAEEEKVTEGEGADLACPPRVRQNTLRGPRAFPGRRRCLSSGRWERR